MDCKYIIILDMKKIKILLINQKKLHLYLHNQLQKISEFE